MKCAWLAVDFFSMTRYNLDNGMKLLFFVIIVFIFLIPFFPDAHSTTKIVTEGYVNTSITYPEGIVRGSEFNISFLTENTSSTDRHNATMNVFLPEKIFSSKNDLGFFLERVAGTSSYGKTITIQSFPNSTLGQHFINVNLSHIDSNGERFSSIALPITVREEPEVIIEIIVQDSIYSEAEFPFLIKIESQGSDLRDVTVRIIPAEEITFRGQTLHTFSSIDRDTPITLRAELVTATAEKIGFEHYIPFQIIVEYTDDSDTERKSSKTISVLLRPRTMFELGSEGGFWIGGFYFTPTISIGAFIGIPALVFGSYKWYKKRMKNQKNRSKK